MSNNQIQEFIINEIKHEEIINYKRKYIKLLQQINELNKKNLSLIHI
jgi:hypothetical protein